ncbi:DNA-dependent protein kinase catalytic subunit-like isoform X2 [Dysidea avara]|uniref:DNA-dependent protein kinase catalytic subunit-like isoform X2 n=1 Tax=Dysidea avara TaxID=196820 RepID=UPI00331C856D
MKNYSGFVFCFFIKKFRAIIENRSSDQREIAVAIRGYGHFAAPCRHFMKQEDIQFMFNDIIQRSEQVFTQGGTVSDVTVYHLPSLLEALASIVKEMKQLSELFLSSLERLVVMTFEYYPRLATTNSKQCHFALYKLCLVLSYHPAAVLKNFISHTVYQGLVRSCSYPVVMDVGDGSAAVSMETTPTRSDVYSEGGSSLINKPVSYRDFVGLWIHLLNPDKIKGLVKVCNSPEQRSLVHHVIYTETMATIINIVQKLDLSAAQPNQDHDTNDDAMETDAVDDKPSPTTPDSDAHPVVISGLEAVVPKDFQIFINLVDLCRAILLSCDLHMFEGWVLEFGKQVIIWSSRYPMVSGFYKLLSITMVMCRKMDYFKEMNDVDPDSMETDAPVAIGNTEKQLCFSLFSKFVKEVLVRMRQYKDELLSSCLQLLLSLPRQLVQVDIAALIPALQVAFRLGLSYLPLAMTGIEALEQWSRDLESSVMMPHYKHVLPYLNDYLKSSATDNDEEESTIVPANIIHVRSSRNRRNVLQKWREAIEGSGSSLEKVRLKIISLLGSLGGRVNGDLIRGSEESMANAIVWDTHDKLPFALPFQDMKPTMCLDPFLPRVCELAVSSNDRQTKIAACELLHAMVLLMLGRAAQPVAANKAPMNKLYRKVFPVVLQLACDVEQVAEKLFSPLVFQIIHWFTSNKQYESPDTIALLEAILDGIVHPTDTSLRDFSAKCVRHFLEWSLKQTSKKQLETSPDNVKSLLKRIYSLASHPSSVKRLGAAMTINSIYTVFREEDSLISTFIIEMLCVMLHSLKLAHKDDTALGTVEQARTAIGHITRIIRARSNLLNKPNKYRRVPRGVKSAELSMLVVWLLEQCGSSEMEYRHQCMSLLSKISTLLPGITTANSWIRNMMASKSGHYFVKCFEHGGATGAGILSQPRPPSTALFSLTDYTIWCDKVFAAIDCYCWVFSNGYIAPCEVFGLKPSSGAALSKLLDVIDYFVSHLAMTDVMTLATSGHYTQTYTEPFLPHEEELYNKSRCTLTVELLRFLTILLNHHPKDTAKTIPGSFWSDDLLTVVVVCCIDPQGVGCDMADVKQTDAIYKQVKEVLLVMSQHLPDNVRSQLMTILSKRLTNRSINVSNLMTLTFTGSEPCDHVMMDLLSSALRTLQQAHLLAGVFPSKSLQEVSVDLLDTVLKLATPTSVAGLSGDPLSPSQSKTCGSILQLALEMGPAPRTLINSLITKGSHLILYYTFPDLFNAHFCTNMENYISLILSNAKSASMTTAHILNGLLNYISKDKQNRKQFALSFTNVLLSSWQRLSGWWSKESSDDLKVSAINLLKKALVLEPKVISDTSGSSFGVTFDMFCQLVSDSSLQLSAKVKVLGLLTHFATNNAPDDKITKLRVSLKKMVADQFPLKSTEFPVGTPQYHDYVSAIDKLLQALIASGNSVILDVMVGIICQDPCQLHVCEEQIQLAFNNFITSVTVPVAMEAIRTAYAIFTNENSFSSDARRAAMDRVCLPLLRVCSEQVLREFFLENICDIMTVLDTRESRMSSTTALETQLVSKLCSFALVGLLYRRLPATAVSSPESMINKTFCKGAVKTGKELTQAATKLAHTAKSEDLHGDTTLKELRRQYHCTAYNTLVAIVSCTQKDVKFYTGFLFTENPLKGQFLWDNLVDLERQYQFEVEVEKTIAFKRQLNVIREDIQSNNSQSDDSPSSTSTGHPRYLSSLFLAGSSLSEDVSQFDFSTGAHVMPVLHTRQVRHKTSSSSQVDNLDKSQLVAEEEKVEQDDLNTHEVMATLTQLLTHMEHNSITPAVDEGTKPTDMPSWMTCIHKTFTGSTTKKNVRLFIARLITNRPKVFQPYAQFWLEPLTQLLVTGDNEGIHYLVVEVVVTMLTWAETTIPDDRFLASRLLEFLMQNAHHEHRRIFRNNLEIIKSLVECWRNKLDVPTKIIYQHFSNPSLESKSNLTGIQLLGIVLANGLAPFDPTTSGTIDEKRFYTALVANLKNKYKEIHASAAEVLGMVLNYIAEKKHVDSSPIHNMISDKLVEMVSDARADDKFITCLHKLQQYYPQFTDRFSPKVLFMLPSHHGVFRTMLLEIVLSRARIIPDLFMELRTKGLASMLGHRDEATQMVCLQLMEILVQSMGGADVAYVLPHVTSFATHPSVQCRQLMYTILIAVYSSSTSEDDMEVLSTVKDHLLQGLADDSEAIRLKLFAFWNQESCLPSDALGRLRQLLTALYSPNTEREFLKYSTNLLLELTSRTPDYTKSPFDTPLSECKFEDYHNIDLSWQQKHLQMTPLFAATQAATQQAGDAGASLQPGLIRATQQSMAFTPTQDEGGYSWMTPSVQSQDYTFTMGTAATAEGPQSAMLFTAPKSRPHRVFKPVGPGFGQKLLKPPLSASDGGSQDDSGTSEVLKLKRRFLKDRTVESSFFAKMELRKKKARQELRQRQKAARGSRVVLYRRYREGELPDIQIKYSDVIRPLQALAQRDSSLSRLLFASLFTSILQEIEELLTESEVDSTHATIRESIQSTLQLSVLYHPPFIGGLQDVCYHEKQLQLEPGIVSTTALSGSQQLIGIMLLEKQVLSASDGPKRSKRAKGLPSETTTMWIELGKLYKTLGNYDVLRGIFSGHVGTKEVTKLALEAEERGDYHSAHQYYKEALGKDDWPDEPPTQEEEDLWDQSLLNCYEHLTKWPELEKAVMVNVDDNDPPRLDKIWEDSYHQEQYLPFVLHSKLKLACGGDLDPSLANFIEQALQIEERKVLLENNYSDELALFYLLQNDNDRANYYIDNSYQQFIRDWSNLNSLLSSAHHSRLHSLQKLREMKEYLQFVAKKDNFHSTRPLYQLLEGWRQRSPHPKLDPLSIWDDVISVRRVMLQKILLSYKDSYSDSVSSMDSENTSVSDLEVKVNTSMVEFYLQMADSARLQSNYEVAVRYLKITEESIDEHLIGQSELPLLLLHNVVELRLQQAQTSATPTKWIHDVVPLFDRLGSHTEASLPDSLKRKHFMLLGNTQQLVAEALASYGNQLLVDVKLVRRLTTAAGITGKKMEQVSSTELAHKLNLRTLSSYKTATSKDHQISGGTASLVDALLAMSNWCNKMLLAEEDGQSSGLDIKQFPSVMVSHLLKAMRLGSSTAMQLFPRLLQLVEKHPETRKLFQAKAKEVPCWMFIGWINQMVALLDKSEGMAVHDILISIATEYPQALCYPLKISTSGLQFNATDDVTRANKLAVDQLKSLLDCPLVDDFINALEQLTSPELVFKDLCQNELRPLLECSTTQRDPAQIKKVWQQLYSQLLDHKSWESSSDSLYASSSLTVGLKQKKFAQDYVKKVDTVFGKSGDKLVKMKLREYDQQINQLQEGMKHGLKKCEGAGLLKEYSPWLQNFQSSSYQFTIEVPGQYTGDRKPLPEYHVKIASFDEKVLVLSSIRKPKRITIRGDDEKEYMFLVKGGEDLRLDQRIEQLFTVMNSILLSDSACGQRGLSLKTYQVIPMTPRLGVIEWVNNTKPLKDFLVNAMTAAELKSYSNAPKLQNEWLKKYGFYKDMYKKVNREETEKEYKKKVACFPWNLLRRAFVQLSASPEAFLVLRSHFTKTYASLCVCQYILGIGDRHLSNFMIDLTTGGVVGIDFGHAFGTATQFLPFPELMPFRLTPQIINLLRPLTESGELRSCMSHTLRALRYSPDTLLNTMDVFVKEPSLDWKMFARKQAQTQGGDPDTHETWYPREKVDQAKKKLLGYNSAHIMETDLKLGHGKSQEFPYLRTILLGDKRHNKRAQVGVKCDTVEEQVACLIDHATDVNILGRTWAGWEPWV